MQSNLFNRLKGFLRWMWQQEGTPGYRARGLAIGVFCGCFPLFGLQTLIGLALASLLRCNHLLAAAGTLISNPITYLPLYWLNYQVGSVLLGQNWNDQYLGDLSWWTILDQGRYFVHCIFLGSFIVGLVLGGGIGILSYLVLNQATHKTNI